MRPSCVPHASTRLPQSAYKAWRRTTDITTGGLASKKGLSIPRLAARHAVQQPGEVKPLQVEVLVADVLEVGIEAEEVAASLPVQPPEPLAL